MIRAFKILALAYVCTLFVLAAMLDTQAAMRIPSRWAMYAYFSLPTALLFVGLLGRPEWFWPDAPVAVGRRRWRWAVVFIFFLFVFGLAEPGCFSGTGPAFFKLGFGGIHEPLLSCTANTALVALAPAVVFGLLLCGVAVYRDR